MTPCPQVIESVLKENEKRLNAINAPYDPVRGTRATPTGSGSRWMESTSSGFPCR